MVVHRLAALAVVAAATTALVWTAADASEDSKPLASQTSIEEQIHSFEQWDRKNAFPRNPILFVGSTALHEWPTRVCLPTLPVLNRGLAGASIQDLCRCAERLATPYAPTAIVFCAGVEEIAAGEAPGEILSSFKRFAEWTAERLPGTPLIVLSLWTGPAGAGGVPRVRETNRLLEGYCARQLHCRFVEVAAEFADPVGGMRADYFHEDGRTPNQAGYEVISRKLARQIEAIRPQESPKASLQAPPPEPAGVIAAAPAEVYVASKTSRVFHRADCSSAQRISPENRITFPDRAAAVATGRRPCRMCRP